MTLLLITVIILRCGNALANQWKPFELTVCMLNSTRSINNETSLIDVIDGSKVHLWCHYCNTKEDYNPKIWMYTPRKAISLTQSMSEIEASDDIVDRNISITLSHTLNLHHFKLNESGIYTCRSSENKNVNTFTYLLDGVIYVGVSPKLGTVSQWQEYKHVYIDPVNKRFQLSEEEPYRTFRQNHGLILGVHTIWDNWNECNELDGYQKGKRQRLGRCRVYLANRTTKCLQKNQATKLITYLTDGYAVSCRSIKLNNTIPEISNVIRNIPEYEAEETCAMSKKIDRKIVKNKVKYKVLQQVMEDSHVTLKCHVGTPNSDLKWYKDKKRVKPLYGNILNRREDEPHISIDASNFLHILHISKKEEGVYICSINGKKVEQFEVKVVSKSKLLNQEFIRYSIYLGFVLSLTMTCYCAGVCVAWHRRASFADPLNLYKKNRHLKYEHEKLLN